MKRMILLLFVAVLSFSSCENLEDNRPALQGEIDSIFFRANDVRGELNEDGSVTLQGLNGQEKVTLHMQAGLMGTYPLGGGNPNWAIYENPGGDEYTTAPFGSGVIEITDRCISNSCGSLTGNFSFMAKHSQIDSLNVVVQKGIFFEASFLGDNVDEGAPSLSTMTALINGQLFTPNAVTAEVIGNSLVVAGFLNNQIIRIEVPANAVSGNYFLPQNGYSASYTIDDVTTEAEAGGRITVNFNNTSTGVIRIFFRFVAGNANITEGDARGEY